MYDLKSAGSIFKVLMFIGSLEFCRQTDRQTDRHYDCRRGLIIIVQVTTPYFGSIRLGGLILPFN